MASGSKLIYHILRRHVQTSRAFSAIPGPLQLPLVGSLWTSLTKAGKHMELFDVQQQRLEKYGTLYREKYPQLPAFVVAHVPGDAEMTFRSEGRCPVRVPISDLWTQMMTEELQLPMGLFLS